MINYFSAITQCKHKFDSFCEFRKDKKSLNNITIDFLFDQFVRTLSKDISELNQDLVLDFYDYNLDKIILQFLLEKQSFVFLNVRNINYMQFIYILNKQSLIIDLKELNIDELSDLNNFLVYYLEKYSRELNIKINSIYFKINNLYKLY